MIDLDKLVLGQLEQVEGFCRYLRGDGVVSTSEKTINDLGSVPTLVEMTASGALSIASSNAADASAGTGARTVCVTGLDAEWNMVHDTVTLNGQTAVTLPTVVLHPFLIQVLTAGTGETNAGILYVGSGTFTSGVPAVINLACAAGAGQSRTAFMPVPSGYMAIVKNVAAGMDAAGKVYAKFKPFGGVYWFGMGFTFTSSFNYAKEDILTPAFPPKTLIKITSIAASTAIARASANIIFKKV